LVEQSFYKYDVVAVNSYGTSTPVLSGTIQAPISVPLAPAPVTSALAAAVGKPANVNLGWTNLAFNQTGYSITRTGGAAFAPATLAANATAYVDTTAQEGFTYTYNVCATNTSLTGAVQSGCTSTVIASPITVPLQPTDLTATALTAPLDSNGLYPDVVTLKWTDKAFNETGYEILRGGVVIGTVNTTAATGTAMTYTDPTPAPSSLLDGHAYSYTVAAINSVNPSAAGVLATSNAAPVTMPGLALPAPTNVVATPNRAGAFIGLTWTNPASTTALPITGVLIQESINGGAWVNATAILPAGTATFRRNAAVAGNVYNFRIAEVNVAQKSDSAYTYIAATLSSPPAPAAPVFTSTAPVPAANGTVTLNWNAIAPIAGTTMAYRLNITVGGVTTTVNTARTTYTFRPTAAQVGAGATFSFTVQSVETATVVAGATLFGSSTSVASAPATVALTPAAAPAALASVTATVASATSATLSWTDNTTTETSYLVTILNNTTGVTTTATVTRTAAQTTGTGTAVTYNAAVVVGNSYTFSVVAQNTKYGVTMNSAAVSTTLVVPTLPAVPATPSVTSTATGVTVSWGTAVAGATAYTLQYSTNGGTTWTSVGTGATGVRMAALTGASTSAAVTGLTGNTSYTFHLLATNAVGSSAYSAASAATLTAPTVPTAARAANGTAGAPITGGLSWTAPAGGATSYIVSWTGPATGSVTIASPAVTTGQLTFATAGTYNMTVTAVNTTGSSPATAAVAVTVR
jgi:titin